MKTTHILPAPILAFVFTVALFSNSHAEVKPNGLFTDNAVLQQGVEVPVWGTARDGEKVSVEIAGQKVSTTATGGKWMVRLKPMKSGEPLTMTISGDNKIIVSNVLVGEVWICSGQSNMERQLGLRQGQPPITNWEQEVAAANYPQIRHYFVPHKAAAEPQAEVSGKWEVCSPQTVANFTAVGYFFGRDLHKTIKQPVGLIHTSVGGTEAEAWTSRETLQSNSDAHIFFDAQAKALQEYPARLEQYKANEAQLLAKYDADVEQAKKDGKPAPKKPVPPGNPAGNIHQPTGLYNGMIAPLLPYAMRGVIWYQGESNGTTAARGKQYRTLFPAMIGDWRKVWGEGDFPFLFVQVAPYSTTVPEVREAQLMTFQKTPNTAMVVITDHGEANNIHPRDKQPVGERLALAALALAYGVKIEYSGPVFDSMKIDGSRAVLTFKHVGGGLVVKDGELKGFSVAGDDKNFIAAKAVIEGDTVVVSSDQAAKPAAVRYGWENTPDVNLFNKEGLPASPFRTDAD